MVAPRDALLLIFGLVAATGCAGLQDAEYAAANWSRAELGWLGSTTASQRRASSGDYAKGWKAGFYDASSGKACGLPPVPPSCYWSYKYQGCDGQNAIADWYRGYQCGVAAAESKGFPAFHEVPIGPSAPVVNKPGCGACYSVDQCNCENESIPMALSDEPHFSFLDGSPGLIGPAGPSTEIVQEAAVRTASAEQAWIR